VVYQKLETQKTKKVSAVSETHYRKHYSTIFPSETLYDSLTRQTTPIHFVGSDAYTAPLVKIGTDYRSLHRYLQGSIWALSNQ